MKPQVRKSAQEPENFTSERCHIQAIWSTPEDAEVSIARARVEPGVTTALHSLDVDERYIIVAGTAEVEVGPVRQAVGPGDVVVIPKQTPQRITNTGAEDLLFYCVCSPRFLPESYTDLTPPCG